MKKEELVSLSIKKEKKHYTSPRIEAIADVRELTKGTEIGGSDAGGQGSPVPYDPNHP